MIRPIEYEKFNVLYEKNGFKLAKFVEGFSSLFAKSYFLIFMDTGVAAQLVGVKIAEAHAKDILESDFDLDVVRDVIRACESMRFTVIETPNKTDEMRMN